MIDNQQKERINSIMDKGSEKTTRLMTPKFYNLWR